MGTAGGLLHFRDQLLRANPQALLVLHTDICCDFPLAQLLSLHQQQAALVTLTGWRVGSREQASYYGCIVADERGSVRHFVEKPETFVSNLISAGVYALSPRVFPLLLALRDAQGGRDDLRWEHEVLPHLAKSQPAGSLWVLPLTSFWCQIKTAAYSHVVAYY